MEKARIKTRNDTTGTIITTCIKIGKEGIELYLRCVPWRRLGVGNRFHARGLAYLVAAASVGSDGVVCDLWATECEDLNPYF